MTTLWTPVDFENNKLKDTVKGFDAVYNWGSTIEVAASAAYEGSYGCKITPSSSQTTQHACGVKRVPYVSRIRQAFYFHPNAMVMPEASYLRICRNYYSDETNIHYVCNIWYYAANGYRIQIGLGDNTGLITSNGVLTTLTNQANWNKIELDWESGSPGRLRLWVADSLKDTLNVTNNLIKILHPCLGTVRATSGAFSGSYLVDYWEANDAGDDF